MVINMAGTQPIYQRVVIARSHIKPARLEHSSPRECCQINQNKARGLLCLPGMSG